MENAPDSVECPVCGESFDPSKAGGYCTNTDCGEYRWEPEDAGAPADETTEDPETVDPATGEPAADPGAGGGGAAAPAGRDSGHDHDHGATESATDASTGDAGGTDDTTGGGDGPDQVTCPDCGERVPDMDHCVSCGAALSTDEPEADEGPPTCPDCGETLEPEWAACPYCGTQLDDDGATATATTTATEGGEPDTGDAGEAGDDSTPAEPAAPERVVVEVGDTEIPASDGDTVGRKVRSAHVRAGGDEGEAQYIHREHVRFEREDDGFYLVNEGQNGTALNGESLDTGDRRPVGDGDEIEFSQVVTGTVRLE